MQYNIFFHFIPVSTTVYTIVLHKVRIMIVNLAHTGRDILNTARLPQFCNRSCNLPQSSSIHPWSKTEAFNGYLDEVTVNLMAPCEEKPHHDMDEHYQIKVGDSSYLCRRDENARDSIRRSLCLGYQIITYISTDMNTDGVTCMNLSLPVCALDQQSRCTGNRHHHGSEHLGYVERPGNSLTAVGSRWVCLHGQLDPNHGFSSLRPQVERKQGCSTV